MAIAIPVLGGDRRSESEFGLLFFSLACCGGVCATEIPIRFGHFYGRLGISKGRRGARCAIGWERAPAAVEGGAVRFLGWVMGDG